MTIWVGKEVRDACRQIQRLRACSLVTGMTKVVSAFCMSSKRYDFLHTLARAIDVNPNWHTNEFFYENPLNDLRTFLNRNTKVAFHLHALH